MSRTLNCFLKLIEIYLKLLISERSVFFIYLFIYFFQNRNSSNLLHSAFKLCKMDTIYKPQICNKQTFASLTIFASTFFHIINEKIRPVVLEAFPFDGLLTKFHRLKLAINLIRIGRFGVLLKIKKDTCPFIQSKLTTYTFVEITN